MLGRSYLSSRQQRLLSLVLVTCEIIKVLQKPTESGALCNTFLNLGISLFSFSQPAIPFHSVFVSRTLLYETVWNSWSYKDAFNGPKLDDFISFFEKKLSLTLVALSQWYQGYLQQGYPVPQDSPGQGIGLHCEQGE